MKIAIFGVGLIGGSLALCFKNKPDAQVIGYSPNPTSVQKYMKRGVVDEATTSVEQAAADADFIFLCVPVGLLEQYLDALFALPLKPGCIITDVGSTKLSVVRYADQLAATRGDIHFIGGHPMAGSHRSGVEAASSYLFENALYILTPNEHTPPVAYERLCGLLYLTRAQILRLDAAEHDEVVGATSHLPHMIAVALVKQIERYGAANELYETLTAGGFRDITRIASSDPVMWRDILLSNRHVLLKLLKEWSGEVDRFAELLERQDGGGIEQLFREAAQFRSRLPERRKGMITSIFELYVDVPDQPGVIGQIATQLGNHGINLRGIQIIESREDVPGVLRLSFDDEPDLDKAVEVLKRLRYTVHF